MDKFTLDKVHSAICEAISSANREQEMINISGVDPTEDNPDWVSGYDRLLSLLQVHIEQIKELKDHTCEYDHEDGLCRCKICGASGLI
jgi:hypothetical protein